MKRSKKKSPAGRPPAPAVAVEPFYASQAKQDIAWWRKHDPRLLERIVSLIAEIRRTPFTGRGKPEPLKGEWRGYWSRRITEEHRLVYRVEGRVLYIAQARYHY